MISQMIPLAATIETTPLQLFVSREDLREDELRRIKVLVDEWLVLQYEPEPDATAIRKKERKLHVLIKASGVYGMVLNFAGLNLWVDDRTPEGVVESQEAINL